MEISVDVTEFLSCRDGMDASHWVDALGNTESCLTLSAAQWQRIQKYPPQRIQKKPLQSGTIFPRKTRLTNF